MDYKFQRTRADKIPRAKIIEELEKVAQQHNYLEFSSDDFSKNSSISVGTVKNEFGSWHKALSILKERLKEKGLDLIPRQSRSHLIPLTDKDLFEEMERIWNQLGHRPSCVEWKNSKPKITLGTYRYRFNGWANACLKFIEYKMGTNIVVTDENVVKQAVVLREDVREQIEYRVSKTRVVPASVRVRILDRDNFRCVFCGRSPATDPGIKLHIDHKIPFSKGGRTTIDNLQTLCQDCNLGKSDEVYNK